MKLGIGKKRYIHESDSERAYYGIQVHIIISNKSSTKNKIVSKGIFLFHMFYKPVHIPSGSAFEKNILSKIIHYCRKTPGDDHSLSTILQSCGVPQSSLFSVYSLLSRLNPRCGFLTSIVNNEIRVSFIPSL